jgi:4-amino-4-deoxy-L-arabinose transferase-like glycosyltransferase
MRSFVVLGISLSVLWLWIVPASDNIHSRTIYQLAAEATVQADERQALTLLKAILAASMLSTAIHYTDNFVQVNRYPGPGGSFYTVVRVAIVVSWPLLTGIGLIGYRRYRDHRYQEARVCLCVYSLTGLVTLGHFIYGNPKIAAFFYATLFTDALCGLAVLAFVLWSAKALEPHRREVVDVV